MKNVELKLLEMAMETNNKFFALNLQNSSQPIIRPSKSNGSQERKAS